MKRVTAIFPDQSIVVDGVGVKVDSDLWTFDVPGAHAIQWYQTEGDIEFATIRGRIVRPAEPFKDASLIEAMIDVHAKQLLRNEAELAAAEKAVADFVEEQMLQGEVRLLEDRLNETITVLDDSGNLATTTSEEWLAIQAAEALAKNPEPVVELP